MDFKRFQRIRKFVLANLRESFAIELGQYKDTSARDHEIAVRLNELQEQHRAFVDKRELFDKELFKSVKVHFFVCCHPQFFVIIKSSLNE